jgi:hypothetical protein
MREMKHHPIDIIKSRLARHMNWLCFTHGPPGCGKSESNLGIAVQLDPDFTCESVCFTVQDYVTAMKEPRIKVLVFDDCGYGMSSRKHQSQENQVSSVIAQTTRVLGKASLYNSPDIKFADVSIRRLAHTLIEPVEIDLSNHLNIVKWLNITYNARIDKTYYQFPRVILNGRQVRATRIAIDRAPTQIVHEYEKLKSEFIQKLLEEANERLADKLMKKQEAITPQSIVDKLYADPTLMSKLSIIKTNKVVLDRDLIAMEFGIGRSRADRVVKLVIQTNQEIRKKAENSTYTLN